MNVVRIHGRGGPEFLKYEDAPISQLVPGDALVRVHATGITPAELGWDETYKNMDGSDRLLSIPDHEVSGAVRTLSIGQRTSWTAKTPTPAAAPCTST